MTLTEFTGIVPAGTYVLGDPCYTVPNDQWDDLLDANDMFETPLVEFDGHVIVGFSTAYGDGTYPDNFGNDYYVDAGLIGLVPLDFDGGNYPAKEGMSVVTFTEPTKVWTDGEGRMKFGEYEIDTSDDYLYEEWDADEEFDEEEDF